MKFTVTVVLLFLSLIISCEDTNSRKNSAVDSVGVINAKIDSLRPLFYELIEIESLLRNNPNDSRAGQLFYEYSLKGELGAFVVAGMGTANPSHEKNVQLSGQKRAAKIDAFRWCLSARKMELTQNYFLESVKGDVLQGDIVDEINKNDTLWVLVKVQKKNIRLDMN